MKYVLIEQDEKETGGLTFCEGIFDDLRTALGAMYLRIEDFHDSYRKPDEVFIVGELFNLDGDGGMAVEVEYKAPSWEKSCKDIYMVLEYEDDHGMEAEFPNVYSYGWAKCPACKRDFQRYPDNYMGATYCPFCGQKLRWKNYNELVKTHERLKIKGDKQ